MKKRFIFLSAIVLLVLTVSMAGAMIIQPEPQPQPGSPAIFQPDPADLWDLSHSNYYIWGIYWNIPDGEVITKATLFFDNIQNSDNPSVLWVHLLDTTVVGTFGYNDTTPGDEFDGQGVLLNHWVNLSNSPQDITYSFDSSEIAALNGYAADGFFGLGFDPDCHFSNNGITLTIETAQVPIPAAFWLLASGLVGLVGIRKKTGQN